MKKIKIAFICYSGMLAAGTQRWLQNVAMKLNKDKFDIDYFYVLEADENRKKIMLDNGINLIKITASGKVSDWGEWIDTDLFEKFDESKYDIIQTAIAGEKEWPFYLFKTPVIHSVHLDYGIDFSPNVYHCFFISDWMRKKWVKMGGIKSLTSVASCGVPISQSEENLRKELNISEKAIVAGFHQRVDDNTFSEIPLKAFAQIQSDNRYFLILGGSKKYAEQAQQLGIKNFIQLEHSSDNIYISKFLNTLDIFGHGRRDGETFGYVFAEALLHHCPCLGHKTKTSNAHKETMGPGGLFAKNQKDYTYKLEQLFNDYKLRDKLANKGFLYAKKRFVDTDYIKEIEKVYENIYNNRSYYDTKVKLLNVIRKIKRFKLIHKEKKTTGERIIYLFGKKLFSYNKH